MKKKSRKFYTIIGWTTIEKPHDLHKHHYSKRELMSDVKLLLQKQPIEWSEFDYEKILPEMFRVETEYMDTINLGRI